jgi:preprotein translocase subunit SecA
MGKKILYQNLKKEAFILFEGLLAKIKNDLIKFLLNLNIVVSIKKKSKIPITLT